jgi:hypothetical protein
MRASRHVNPRLGGRGRSPPSAGDSLRTQGRRPGPYRFRPASLRPFHRGIRDPAAWGCHDYDTSRAQCPGRVVKISPEQPRPRHCVRVTGCSGPKTGVPYPCRHRVLAVSQRAQAWQLRHARTCEGGKCRARLCLQGDPPRGYGRCCTEEWQAEFDGKCRETLKIWCLALAWTHP